jgi:multiple sugar transport system substrate-binding protein
LIAAAVIERRTHEVLRPAKAQPCRPDEVSFPGGGREMSSAQITRRHALQAVAGGVAGLALAGPARAAAAQASVSGASVSGNLVAWDWSDAPWEFGEKLQTTFYQHYIPSTYKQLKFSSTIFGYTDLLPKLTVAWRAGNGPDVVRVPIAWSPQLVGADQCAEITEAELGFPASQFFPQALLSVRKKGAANGPLYGVPTNNESMFLLYNKSLYRKAGLDPEKPPATWAELADYSKTIHDKTGAYGFGLCAQQNIGNTPFRFMPVAWAHGGQIFDELSPQPTWSKVGLGDEGVVEALSLYDRMFNVDKSVQPSALSDNERNVETLFLDGKCAMCIDQPPFALQVHSLKPDLDLGGAMLPAGPVRRAVVLGGSNMHIRANTADKAAAIAFMRAYLSPEWNAQLGVGAGSEPSTSAARASQEMQSLKQYQPFNDLVFKMLPYGVNVPLVTEGAQIWNIVIPTMIQQVLTKTATAKDAASAAAGKVRQLMATG